jgi:hypothetical protein
MANESLIHDALHLSDDDFGSKYGRDRTAKETVARSANETAGYKAAEDEAKKDSYFKRTYPKEWDKRIEEAKTAKAVDEARFNEVGEKAAAKSYSKSKGGGGGGGGSGDLEKGMMGGRFKPVAKAKGGSVSSASRRADGIATKGKTRGRIV